MSEELWKIIPGFESYEVSDHGRVRRVNSTNRPPGYVLRERYNEYGYQVTTLTVEGRQHHKYIHRLVMLAFVGPLPDGREVNHIDGVKSNNNLSNLEYCTPAENIRHAVANGLTATKANGRRHTIPPVRRGSENNRAVLSEEDVRTIIKELSNGASQHGLARRFSCTQYAIYSIAHGRTWKHIPRT